MSDGAGGLEEYRRELFAHEDEVLRSVMPAAVAQGLPDISVDADSGKTLHLLARMVNARKILEFGSLAGYSGIWLARALGTGGKLVSLEIDAKHAEIARANYRKAGVADRAEVRVGPAAQTMKGLSGEGPFDLVFIDADKEGYPEYLEFAIANTRTGGLIVADNARPRSLPGTSARDRAIMAYNERAARHPKLVSTILPVGGWLAVSLVTG